MNTDNKNTDTQTIEKKWYRVRDAAEYLGVSEKMVYNLVKEGRLKRFTPVGGRTVYFSQEQLDNYVMGVEE